MLLLEKEPTGAGQDFREGGGGLLSSNPPPLIMMFEVPQNKHPAKKLDSDNPYLYKDR